MRVKEHSYLLLLTYIVAMTSLGPREVRGYRHYTKQRLLELREQVRVMFQHAYDGYLRHASDYDELRPLTCDGIDTWGSYSLTLIDALDTLATMGNFTEFRRVALLLETKMNFDKDINVSVFETNIRIVGGLLSAHLLSKKAGLTLEVGWPCQGPLLRLAEDVARRLLPAFDTATGMPYGTVNLRYGVPKGETPITCTAGVGTFLIEFGTLSRLTGDSIYEDVALNAVYALWERRSSIGLFGNHIDIQTGRWTALDAGIGAGVDSFFEYLVKGSILLNRPELLEMFHEARRHIDKYLKRDDWYVWAGMNKGQVTLPVFQSLEAFWPGVLSMVGDIGPALRTLSKYSSVWRQYGFLPEFYNIPAGEASPKRESYPLRPELVESLMFLYRATKNQFLLEVGEHMLETIEFSAKTKCGYATIRNVITHEKGNRMESFFLSETTKYLYLLFDENNFLHNDAGTGDHLQMPENECVIHTGPYIFNTEAHPVDMSALYCCHDVNEDIYEGLDLELFSANSILAAEREQRLAKEAENSKYQCDSSIGNDPPATKHTKPNAKKTESSIAVDIEVFDENNNPAADVLIDHFERIKKERQTTAAKEPKGPPRNQLTVTDLDEFFVVLRKDFKSPQDVFSYVTKFMQNFTLDSAFISGLQLFDKNLTSVLGAVVQKEYEENTRTLWELYELNQRYATNARLVIRLGLTAFDNDSREQLEQVLEALDYGQNTSDDPALRVVLDKINLSRLEYEIAMFNTTAMQEFLLKILISGTTEKKRTFVPLLSAVEISTLSAPEMDDEAQQRLFTYVRRIVEFKKRMIETFEKLQALMQDNTKLNINATTESPNNDNTAAATEIPKSEEPKAEELNDTQESTSTENETGREQKSAETEDTVESVWSQLVQSILRKTTKQRTKFDEEYLRQKTRSSLQKYIHKPVRHELLTCQRPSFIERFAYRDFQP